MKSSYRVAYRDNVTHAPNKLRISKSNTFKIYYYHEGEGELRAFVNGALFTVEPGQVLLVPEGAFSGMVKKHKTRYARCVSLFSSDLADFLGGVEDGMRKLLSYGALFTLESAAADAYADIISSLDENARGVTAIELILKQLRVLSECEYKKLDTVSGGRLYDAVTSLVEEEHLTLNTAEEIAHRVGYSKNYLCRHFKDKMNIGLHDYLIARKLFSAIEMLSGGMGVTDVAYACGFSGASHFISVFRAHYGTTPKKYIKQIVEN